MLSNDLNTAIDQLNPEAVKQLLNAGANPYFPGDDGRTPVQTWFDSQRLGNPYAEKMGQALFAVNPISLYEEAELARIAEQQAERLAHAQGVAEQGRQMGIEYPTAYLPPQPLGSAKACWAIVYQAMDRLHDQPPVVSPHDFAMNYAAGAATARALLSLDPATGGVLLKDNGGAPVQVAPTQYTGLLEAIRATLGDQPMTVSPSGELRQYHATTGGGYLGIDGMGGNLTPGHATPAGTSYVDMDAKGVPVVLVPDTYWHEKSLEERLDQALQRKDWSRAQALVNEGANVHNLPLDHTTDRMRELNTAEDMQKLFSLGFNPLFPIPGLAGAAPQSALQLATSQQQFDALASRMKEMDVRLDAFEPNNSVRPFWENSRHYVETRPQGAVIGEWVGSKIRQAFLSVEQWRQQRNPGPQAPDHEPSAGPSAPKPK